MRIFYIFLLAFTLLMAGCKKDSDEDSTTSSWTINGKSYTALKTLYSVADDALVAIDNEDLTKAKTGVMLSFEEKPGSSGAYQVIQWEKDGPMTGEIYIEIVIDGINYYESSGQNGDYASVSILSSGRLKVTFSNITFIDDNDNKVKASGTIVEQ